MIKNRKARKSFTEWTESGCTGIHSWQEISDRVYEAGWGGRAKDSLADKVYNRIYGQIYYSISFMAFCHYFETCRGFLRKMLGTRCEPVGTRFSILGTRIGSLKRLKKNPKTCFLIRRSECAEQECCGRVYVRDKVVRHAVSNRQPVIRNQIFVQR